MAKKIIWINFWYILLYFTATIICEDHEHIHIKLHLPEVIQKHTHLRTVVKHHFHPKKINKVHHHHHHVDEALAASAADLDPGLSIPSYLPPIQTSVRPTLFHHGNHFHNVGHFPIGLGSWEPKHKIIDVKFRKPHHHFLQASSSSILPHPPLQLPPQSSTSPLSTTSYTNWDLDNDLSKYFRKNHKFLKSKYNTFTNYLPNYELIDDIKYHNNFDKYEDDEDDFLMTEDTSLEHPSTTTTAIKLKNSLNTFNTLPNNYDDNNWMTALNSDTNSMDSTNSYETLNSDLVLSGNNNDNIWSNLPSIDQTGYASTLQNDYSTLNDGYHHHSGSSSSFIGIPKSTSLSSLPLSSSSSSSAAAAAVAAFNEYNNFHPQSSSGLPFTLGTATKSTKLHYEPNLDNYFEYKFNKRQPYHKYNWKKMKKNKLHSRNENSSSNNNNFRIRV